MPATNKHINLLPPDPFEQSMVGRFLKWALSVGRYIVIGTELVVIGSFLTRFSLDRQVTDLNESIAQKQAIIASYGDLETQLRQFQAQLKLVEELDGKTLHTKTFVETISEFTPVDVVYQNVQIKSSTIEMTGTAFSEAGFRTLLSQLKSLPEATKIAVTNMSSGTSGGNGITFSIAVQLAPSRNRSSSAGGLETNDLGFKLE